MGRRSRHATIQVVVLRVLLLWASLHLDISDAFRIPLKTSRCRTSVDSFNLLSGRLTQQHTRAFSTHPHRGVMMSSSKEMSSELRPTDLLPIRHNGKRSNETAHSMRDPIYSNDAVVVKEEDDYKATDATALSSETKTSPKQKKRPVGIEPRPDSSQPSFAVPLLLPWSLWMHARSELRGNINGDSDKTNIKSNKKQKRRRWEIPLTSKPFEGFEFLRSTVVYCCVAIAIYFMMGTLLFPLWLEPSWSFIDALYFSMTTLTTVGYGDLVPGSRGGIIGKLFLLFFNIYAVCISVSALGVIAKLALSHQKKLISKAKERARSQLIKIFDAEEEEEEDDEDGEEEDDDDDEECRWIDNILDDRCTSNQPLSLPRVLLNATKNHIFNFLALILIAAVLQRIEKWSLVDLLYYWNSTATTIGFGDVSPRTQLGRLVAVIFIPLSVVTLGEVIANCFAFITSRASAKAEKDFLRREITLSDLEYLDIDDDGKVCEMDFVTFMLVAMQKVDKKTMIDLKRIFHALDVGKDGYIQKEDLITLRQRKRVAKRLRREAKRNKKIWYL